MIIAPIIGASREEERDDPPEHADEHRASLGLLLVVRRSRAAPGGRGACRSPSRAERVELASGDSSRTRTLETAPSRPNAARERVDVDPHLGLVRRAAGLEDADDLHGPVLPQLEGLVELDALEAAADALADR